MFLNLIRWFRGYVVFEIIGKFPERFINLSTRQGRFVFFTKSGKCKFTAALLLCDFRAIRPIARKSSVRLKILERHGLPFLIRRYRVRWGLALGLIMFLSISVFMQNFVWTIECNGLVTVSQSVISDTLREEGVFVGAFKPFLDLSTAQRNIMKKTDEIGWMSINIIGTKAEVEIKEKELKPHILEADVPCNIKASKDGLIVRMNTKYGKAVISPGSAVIEGSLLVSCVVENPSGEVSIVHADAEVMAQTQRTQSLKIKKEGSCFVPCEEANRYALSVFGVEFPLTGSVVKEPSTSLIETNSIYLNNTRMPFSLIREHCTRYTYEKYSLSHQAVKKTFDTEDYLYRLFALAHCESVSACKYYDETEDEYTVNVLYDCVEDIAVAENFVVN